MTSETKHTIEVIDINIIKQYIIEHNPSASFTCADKHGLHFIAPVVLGEESYTTVSFQVPLSDIGDMVYACYIPSKLLINYIK